MEQVMKWFTENIELFALTGVTLGLGSWLLLNLVAALLPPAA
jgi:hypothetical protein